MKRVLVTGGAGYIGSVLVRQLLNDGFRVRVVDNLRFGGESLIDLLANKNFEFIKADVRDEIAMTEAVKDVWGIVHLAAIVGDPACAKEPELTREINLDASKQLYELAEEAAVKRFIFASTCSNYGKMADPNSFVDENSDLRPVSLYAETKVEFENYLLAKPKANNCKPTCLRYSTVYGLSPRMRFDLTVNEFTKDLAMGKELVIFGEQFWRPYCHVIDLARSALSVLNSAEDKVAFDVFNVGDSNENYQKQMLVEEMKKEIPDAKISYVKKDDDPRDYRVAFGKIKEKLGFEITKTVPDGIKEIKYVVENGLLNNPDDGKYKNI